MCCGAWIFPLPSAVTDGAFALRGALEPGRSSRVGYASNSWYKVVSPLRLKVPRSCWGVSAVLKSTKASALGGTEQLKIGDGLAFDLRFAVSSYQ
jgi:hypothetical protein